MTGDQFRDFIQHIMTSIGAFERDMAALGIKVHVTVATGQTYSGMGYIRIEDDVPGKPYIRYDVISEPSPEYLAGSPGRNGIYTVVKLVDDLPPEAVKVFDGCPSSQSRTDAYAYAVKLNDEMRGGR